MTNDRRVLIVGWDGGTWRVFRPLAEKGLMPRLKALMDRGCHGIMNSTIPPITPPAWTTLLTGTKPEKHGIFSFMENMLPGEAASEPGARPLSSLAIKGETILDILGNAGRPVMSINVPMSYPPRPVNGVMITGMLTPGDAENYTYPPELKDELDGYLIDVAWDADIREQAKGCGELSDNELIRRCTEIVRTRCEHVLRLAEKHPWDFGIVIFTSTDRIFHRLWATVESLVRSGRPSSKVEGLLAEFFAQLDRSLGELIDAYPDATTMLVSDHGFGPPAQRTIYPDVLLEREGLLTLKGEGSVAGRALQRRVRGAIRGLMRVLLPRRLRRALLGKVRGRKERMREAIDRERSLCHFVLFDKFTLGGIRLNPAKTASMSENEKRDLVDHTIRLMKDVKDPQTGETAIVNAWRREELFGEVDSGCLPEVVLQFREGYTGGNDPFATQPFGGPTEPPESGFHCIEGMFVLAGPDVRRSGDVPPLYLGDIAPLVLYLNDLPVPASMQGEVPLRLFDESHVQSHPVRTTDRDVQQAVSEVPDAAYTAEQEEKVKQRLRELGYLD